MRMLSLRYGGPLWLEENRSQRHMGQLNWKGTHIREDGGRWRARYSMLNSRTGKRETYHVGNDCVYVAEEQM